MNGKRGFVLISAYLVIAVLAVLMTALILFLITESRSVQRQVESVQAFYLAEAALDRGISQLPGNTTGGLFSLGAGEYDLTITPDARMPKSKWRIRGTGYVPSEAEARSTRAVEAVLISQPLNLNQAIYTAGDVDINGSAYSIEGDVYLAGSIDNTDNISGLINVDPSINPLFTLDFGLLRQMAVEQGNLFTAGFSVDDLPDDFWYDEESKIPNVVYIESDLTLNGNIGQIGGFILVLGDVITNPGAEMDTTINGKGEIEGFIYTRGLFRVNGGGSEGFSVEGGIISGSDGIAINGNVDIAYEWEYANAIRDLGLTTTPHAAYWQEIR
ncbi:MAG: hypothetical protein AUJ75_02105 [Candidatus Omnitrophica bacterium CG1_02_49_10]|nr:MAG: hypothetical protein AUJ75_02105 [Candidatus Omnitrophica bacterium CG1_02_49_10]